MNPIVIILLAVAAFFTAIISAVIGMSGGIVLLSIMTFFLGIEQIVPIHGVVQLVFDNDKPVGWCSANDRSNYQRLVRDYDLIDNSEDKACSVVCFLIHPDYRRQGIAQKILHKIIEDYSNTDYDYIESYPKKGQLSCSGNFKGPLELYKKFDFEQYKEYDDYYVMRKKLK